MDEHQRKPAQSGTTSGETRMRAAVTASSMLALAAGLLVVQPAAGQTGASASAEDDGAIIVTARRREESLLDVPIAVSAFSGDTLERAAALDITDLTSLVPNVTLEVSRGTNSTLTAFIRGVGQQDPVAGFEAGVGLYLDDVYLNRPQAAVLDIYDVERIEVLRGPQGTLYGRNTIGGAVKYVTRRLGDDPELRFRGTYGTYNQAEGVVSASMPIGDSGFKVGGALARLYREGFGTNLTTGDDNYDKDIWAARGTLQFDPDDIGMIRISGDYTRDRSNARGGHRLIPGIRTGVPVLEDVFDSRGALADPKQDVTAWGISALAEVRPSDVLTLRAIIGWRKDESNTPIDFDALPAVDVDVPAVYENEQFSQELQALVDFGRLNGLVGVYHLNANAQTVFDVRLPGGVTALTFGDVDTKTTAIFADFTFDLTERLSLSAGGRYTWDTRGSRILRQTFLLGGSPFFGGNGILFATTSDFRGEAQFTDFTPRASISFRPNRDHNIYFSYSQGFKGGGFDPRGQTTACRTLTGGTCTAQEVFDFIAFDPETVDSFELGWKASLFDGALNLATAAFYSKYKDVQIPGSIGVTVGGQQTFIGITTNAARANISGIEFEANWRLGRDLLAGGDRLSTQVAVGYIDAEYKEFIDARGIDVAENRAFQNTPKWTASGGIDYRFPLFAGDLTIGGRVSYRGSSQQFELRNEFLDQDGFVLLDGSLVWNSPNDRWTLGVYGKNLMNKEYIVSGYTFLSQNPDTGAFNRTPTGAFIPTLGQEGVLTAYYGNPRQVFASIGVKF
jgi:iron complex outermembrane receptor protein